MVRYCETMDRLWEAISQRKKKQAFLHKGVILFHSIFSNSQPDNSSIWLHYFGCMDLTRASFRLSSVWASQMIFIQEMVPHFWYSGHFTTHFWAGGGYIFMHVCSNRASTFAGNYVKSSIVLLVTCPILLKLLSNLDIFGKGIRIIKLPAYGQKMS